eukprot:Skav209619  [mRNA]  locus=scaffold902:64398:65364:+ [translate_table: standard]
MQTPGQQFSQLAQQNSVSNLVARVRARSAGTPMPFASQGPVENSESGRGPGLEYPTMGHGDMFSGIVTPVMVSVTFCIMIGKTLCK